MAEEKESPEKLSEPGSEASRKEAEIPDEEVEISEKEEKVSQEEKGEVLQAEDEENTESKREESTHIDESRGVEEAQEAQEEDLLAGLIEEEGSDEETTSKSVPDLPEDDPLAGLLDESEELAEDEIGGESEEEEREEGGEPSGESVSKESSRKGLFLTVASILSVLILWAGGLMTLWYLWQHPPETQSLIREDLNEASSENKSSAPLTSAPFAVEDRKILFLKNFLIPYQRESGEYLFVKAKVLLYYSNERDFTIAKKNEALLREHIYRLLKNVPLYVWESKKGEPLIRKELLSYLAKKEIGGVVPRDLEVTGYILK